MTGGKYDNPWLEITAYNGLKMMDFISGSGTLSLNVTTNDPAVQALLDAPNIGSASAPIFIEVTDRDCHDGFARVDIHGKLRRDFPATATGNSIMSCQLKNCRRATKTNANGTGSRVFAIEAFSAMYALSTTTFDVADEGISFEESTTTGSFFPPHFAGVCTGTTTTTPNRTSPTYGNTVGSVCAYLITTYAAGKLRPWQIDDGAGPDMGPSTPTHIAGISVFIKKDDALSTLSRLCAIGTRVDAHRYDDQAWTMMLYANYNYVDGIPDVNVMDPCDLDRFEDTTPLRIDYRSDTRDIIRNVNTDNLWNDVQVVFGGMGSPIPKASTAHFTTTNYPVVKQYQPFAPWILCNSSGLGTAFDTASHMGLTIANQMGGGSEGLASHELQMRFPGFKIGGVNVFMGSVYAINTPDPDSPIRARLSMWTYDQANEALTWVFGVPNTSGAGQSEQDPSILFSQLS